MTVAPHVLGLTYNGARDTRQAATIRLPFQLPRAGVRVRLALSAAMQDAEEATLSVPGVTLVKAVVGTHAGGGKMGEVLAVLGEGADLSEGVWVSDWAEVSLPHDRELVVSISVSNPQGASMAAGAAHAWSLPDSTLCDSTTAEGWKHAITGPLSPVLIVDMPGAPKRVAVLGDSNAAGRGTNAPYHLSASHVAARSTGHTVTPIGHSGETSSDWSDHADSPKWWRVRDLAGGLKFDAAVIALGTNDFLIGRDAPAVQGHTEANVTLACQHVAGPVWLATVPPANLNATKEQERQTFNAWVRSTPAGVAGVVDFDAALADPDTPAKLAASFDSGDGVHPNAAGCAAMAVLLTTVVDATPVPAAPAGAALFENPPTGRRFTLWNPGATHAHDRVLMAIAAPPSEAAEPLVTVEGATVTLEDVTA